MYMLNSSQGGRSTRGRRSRAAGAVLALLMLPLGLAAGCGDEESQKFRAAAFPDVEDGIKKVAEGLIEGFFTLNTPAGQNAEAAN